MIEAIALREGNFYVSKEKDFIPLVPDSPNGLKVAVQPFLIKIDTGHVLLDAGLGTQDDNGLLLHQRLQQAGVAAEDIDAILLSHLHKDHVSGLGFWKTGVFQLNFPNAKIYVQSREFYYALKQVENPSYSREILEALKNLSEVVWMSDDHGAISDNISYEVTGGHSPFHQVFWIKDGNKTYFYGADNLPQKGYFDLNIAYKTDYDGESAKNDRQTWRQRAEDEHWRVLFYHDMGETIVQYGDHPG